MVGKDDRQTILVVDDIPDNIDLLSEILYHDYHVKVAISGEKALEIASGDDIPDLILLDIVMPGMGGYEVCRRLKQDERTRKIPVIFVSAMSEQKNEENGFALGAVDFITKPVNPAIVRARVRTQLILADQTHILENKVAEKTLMLREALKNLEESSLEIIERLTQAAEYRDEDTGKHTQRMSHYAYAVAESLGFNQKALNWLLYAAPLHDVGKIGIPDRILLKPGKLDDDEWEIMKQHSVIGAKILGGSKLGYLRLGELIATTHHERWDGKGYPKGLKGDEIPLVAQIVSICDVFDALTTRRPYKEPFSVDDAFTVIREGRGANFKPEVVDAFFASEKKILHFKDHYKDNGPSHLSQFAHYRTLPGS